MSQFVCKFPEDSTRVADAINRLWLADEDTVLRELLPLAQAADPQSREAVTAHAAQLVEAVRASQVRKGAMDALLREYDLSSQEGVILMCLAEALLRHLGAGRFQAFSAGSAPRANQQPNPLALEALRHAGVPVEGLHARVEPTPGEPAEERWIGVIEDDVWRLNPVDKAGRITPKALRIRHAPLVGGPVLTG